MTSEIIESLGRVMPRQYANTSTSWTSIPRAYILALLPEEEADSVGMSRCTRISST